MYIKSINSEDKLKLFTTITYLLTPWSTVLLEKLTGFAANQEIPRILWNPEVHYRTHKRPPPVPILSQLHPVPKSLPTSWRSILILSSHLRLGLPNGTFYNNKINKYFAWFRAFALVYPRSSFFWGFTRRRYVVCHESFGTTCLSLIQRSCSPLIDPWRCDQNFDNSLEIYDA